MKVGFVGLGQLGTFVARRIARSGFALTICDISPAALAAFDEPGVARETDAAACARAVDALCVCVRTDADLLGLVGDGTVFKALGQGGTFIINSTIAPALCRQIAASAKPYGVDVIDCGISPGGPSVVAGESSIFVGADDAAFARVKSLLQALGKVTHFGPVGRGMEAKLLNNLASTANYAMSAAILDVGARLNFDRDQLWQALMSGSAQGFALRSTPNLLRPENAGAARDVLQKDFDHARTLAPDDPAMATLVSAAQSMLDRLSRAAAEKR